MFFSFLLGHALNNEWCFGKIVISLETWCLFFCSDCKWHLFYRLPCSLNKVWHHLCIVSELNHRRNLALLNLDWGTVPIVSSFFCLYNSITVQTIFIGNVSDMAFRIPWSPFWASFWPLGLLSGERSILNLQSDNWIIRKQPQRKLTPTVALRRQIKNAKYILQEGLQFLKSGNSCATR